jgi:argininosuccinate synthase
MVITELKGQKVGICVSGGLDSRTITKKLVEMGVNVTCFTADLGQPDEIDINDIKTKMAPCGAETAIIDLKLAMAEACFDVIKAQAMYDGGYWNSTGIARAVTVRGLIPEMKKRGCTVLAHGATGRGNDQMRFERPGTRNESVCPLARPVAAQGVRRTHPDGRLSRQVRDRGGGRWQKTLLHGCQPGRLVT